MRRALAIGAAAAACAAGLTGCGGGGSLGRPLSYLPAGTPAVALVNTDLDDSQWHTFNGEVAPLLVQTSVRRILRETAQQAGLSFGDDVKPLLGNPLVVGVAGPGPALVAALQVRDAGKLDRVLHALDFAPAGRYRGARLYRPPTAVGARLARARQAAGGVGPLIAVDGDVVVAALDVAVLRRALDQRRGGGGLGEREVEHGLNGLPGDALLRVYGNLRAVAAAAPAGLPWVRALRTYALSVTFKRRVIEARAVVRTARAEVTDAQVPVAVGRAPAPIPIREDQAVVGLRDVAPAAAFALGVLAGGGGGGVRATPGGAAVRSRGAAVALAAGILRQLAGPAFAAFDLDGDVWVRARVRDPRAAARALRGAARRLGLRAVAGGLFRALRGRLVVGVVDGALVAGPSARDARQTASEPTVGLSSTHGGLVARADLAALGAGIERALGIQLGALDELVAFVNADRAGLRAVLRIGIRADT